MYDGPSIYFFSLLVDPEVLRRGFFGIQNRSGHWRALMLMMALPIVSAVVAFRGYIIGS